VSQNWLGQRERGSPFLMRVISWIALKLGRPFSRVLLVPISLYFLLFSIKARRASRLYLQHALGRDAGWLDFYRHYFCFSATILDRLYFLSGRHAEFDITVHGAEALHDYLKQGRGCILLGAHLGSFEALRALAAQLGKVPFAVLMHVDNAQKMNAIMNSLNPEMASSSLPWALPMPCCGPRKSSMPAAWSACSATVSGPAIKRCHAIFLVRLHYFRMGR
jgi:predicted LPLAT superfamily acyltransferase